MKIRCFLFVALFVALGGAENTFADGVRTLDFEGTQPGRLQKLWNSVTSPLSPIPTTTLATPDLKVFAKEPGFKYLGVTDDRVGDTLFSRIYKFQTNEGIFTFRREVGVVSVEPNRVGRRHPTFLYVVDSLCLKMVVCRPGSSGGLMNGCLRTGLDPGSSGVHTISSLCG